jgi:hypothetical protein
VFASSLVGGSFQAPQELDGTLPGPSSQPVVAAGSGGLGLVAFVNGGQLVVVQRASAAAAWGAPTALASGASSPAIQMTNLGKAYLAFAVADGAGHDVRAAYYYNGAWVVEGPPLNNTPADDAGTGNGRPAVAASGDGVGIVAWGEGGHVFTRRVWGGSPSIVLEQADGALPGCTEVSADQPGIGSGGDSSYAAVSFHEVLNCGGRQQSRVLVNRLHGSLYDGVAGADGLATGSADNADQPRAAIGEYGRGWITSSRALTHDVYGAFFADNETLRGVVQLNGQPNATAPSPVPAIAGVFSDLIAWQHDPGVLAFPEIRARYAPKGGMSIDVETTLSSPSQGPTDAAGGLAAGGDFAGDAAVAWLQGAGPSAQIVVAQLYQPPPAFTALVGFRYTRSSRTLLSWAPSRAYWGPLTYTVSVDGAQVGQTGATAFAVPALSDGQHVWQVTASNRAGLASAMPAARVFVDTVAPKASLRLTGALRAGSRLHLSVAYTDAPPPVSPATASGIARATVYWGDGASSPITHGKAHVYNRQGRYRLRLVVVDRAGNTTTLVRTVKIQKPGQPPPGHAKKPPKRKR